MANSPSPFILTIRSELDLAIIFVFLVGLQIGLRPIVPPKTFLIAKCMTGIIHPQFASSQNTLETKIYLIEDDRSVHRFVQTALQLKPEWKLVGYSDTFAHACSEAPKSDADVYLVDLGLPDGSGDDILTLLSQRRPDAELLVFTVFGDERRLIKALKRGATGYVLKGCRTDELIDAIGNIRGGGAPISPLLARMLLKQFKDVEEEDAVDSQPPAVDWNHDLSDRETEVLKLVAQGYINREIAERLGVGVDTVATYIKRMYRKLAITSRVQAVKAAQARGLL